MRFSVIEACFLMASPLSVSVSLHSFVDFILLHEVRDVLVQHNIQETSRVSLNQQSKSKRPRLGDRELKALSCTLNLAGVSYTSNCII